MALEDILIAKNLHIAEQICPPSTAVERLNTLQPFKVKSLNQLDILSGCVNEVTKMKG